ncbi:MAG: hypothetical protein ABEJ31_05635 [Haloarculaceae archaeon]
MTDDATEAAFAEACERASEAVANAPNEAAVSLYVGLVAADGADEYYFANAVDERELREVATEQLGMLTRVLADESAASVDEIASLAAEQAESLDLRT